MKLTKKLLGYLNRVFDKDAHSFMALRLRYDGAMTWAVSDGVMTTSVTGGPGDDLSVDLSGYTVTGLVNFLAAQPGYTVLSAASGDNGHLSARVLEDGSGNQDSSNGDHIYGYTSLLWAYFETLAVELKEASAQIDEAIDQMNMRHADDYWLDEWGGYYGIERKSGEADEAYANRIIIEIIKPRCNNIAIQEVARELLGQPVTVVDIRLWGDSSPNYNSLHNHDSSILYNASAAPIYGLFDVNYTYNLESGMDVSAYALELASIVETVRAAGTQLRAMNLVSSNLSDTSAITPVDDASLSVTSGIYYNSAVTYSGVATYSGVSVTTESLS